MDGETTKKKETEVFIIFIYAAIRMITVTATPGS
jgi:hypothetical protein